MVDPARTPISDQIKECRQCGTQYPLATESGVCTLDGGQLVTVHADNFIGSMVAARYTLHSPIGVGGSSSVYLAEDVQLKRPVAVKILHHFLRKDETNMKRFQREAVIAASLSHPNITTMFDFGVLANGQPYIVMEYLQGSPLDRLVSAETQLPRARATAIMGQICQAVDHAHQCGLIHRDLKPGNVVLLASDFVKVLDFGLAKSAGEVESLTTTGTTLGTPMFMSPEQCRGAALDGRSDVYSLGVMMHYMLVGAPPFIADSIFEAIHKQITEQPKSLSQCRPDLVFPGSLEEAILKCLSKDPAERFATCLEFKSALENAHHSAPASAVRSTRDEAAKPGKSEAPSAAAPVSTVNMLPSIAALLLVILGLGGALFFGLRKEAGTKTSISDTSPGSAATVYQPSLAAAPPPPAVPLQKAKPQPKPAAAAEVRASTAKRDDTMAPLATKPPKSTVAGVPVKAADAVPTAAKTKAPPPTPTSTPPLDSAKPPDAKISSKPQPASDAHPQEMLMFEGLKSNADALAKLSHVSDCRALHMYDSDIDDRVLEYALTNFPSLRLLAVSNSLMDDKIFSIVSRSNLFSLNVTGTLITDAGLSALHSDRLRNLILSRDKITDAGIRALTGLHLSTLVVRGTPISDHCGESLAKMTSLTTLGLARTAIGDSTIAKLIALPNLNALDLANTNITDACADSLAQMPRLEELSLSQTEITDAGLAKLCASKSLKHLDIAGTKVTSAGLMAVTKLSTLQELRRGLIVPTPETREAFRRAGVHVLSPSESTFEKPFLHSR